MMLYQIIFILLSLRGLRAYIYVYCSKRVPSGRYKCYNATTDFPLYVYSSLSGQPAEGSNSLWHVGSVTCTDMQTSENCNNKVVFANPSNTQKVYFNVTGLQPNSQYEITVSSVFTSDGSFRDEQPASRQICTGSIGSLIPGKTIRVTATHALIKFDDIEGQLTDVSGAFYNHKLNSMSKFYGSYYINQNFYYHPEYDEAATFTHPATLYTMYLRNYTSGCYFDPYVSFQLCSAPLTPILDMKADFHRIYIYSVSNRSDFDSLKVEINHPNTPAIEDLPGYFDNLIPATKYEIRVTVELGSKTNCLWNNPDDLVNIETINVLTLPIPEDNEHVDSNNHYITYENDDDDLSVKAVEIALILAVAILLIYLVVDKAVTKMRRKPPQNDTPKRDDVAMNAGAFTRVIPGSDNIRKQPEPKVAAVVSPALECNSNYLDPCESQEIYDVAQFGGDQLDAYVEVTTGQKK